MASRNVEYQNSIHIDKKQATDYRLSDTRWEKTLLPSFHLIK